MTEPGHSVEERLTRLEFVAQGGLDSIRSEITRLADLMGAQNGRVGRLEKRWIDRDIASARRDGQREGERALRRKDYAILGAMLAAAGTISGIVFSVLQAAGW